MFFSSIKVRVKAFKTLSSVISLYAFKLVSFFFPFTECITEAILWSKLKYPEIFPPSISLEQIATLILTIRNMNKTPVTETRTTGLLLPVGNHFQLIETGNWQGRSNKLGGYFPVVGQAHTAAKVTGF